MPPKLQIFVLTLKNKVIPCFLIIVIAIIHPIFSKMCISIYIVLNVVIRNENIKKIIITLDKTSSRCEIKHLYVRIES